MLNACPMNIIVEAKIYLSDEDIHLMFKENSLSTWKWQYAHRILTEYSVKIER